MANYSVEDPALRRIAEAAQNGAVELDLSNMGISKIPPEIGNLYNLRKLSIGNTYYDTFLERYSMDEPENTIIEIPLSIFGLSNLEELDASGIGLKSIPKEIGCLRKLSVLKLGSATRFWYQYGSQEDREIYVYNALTSLPVEIGALINLKVLYLNNNQLTALPSEIWNLVNLEELYLNDNQLTAIPAEIKNLVRLRCLNIKNNPIVRLPKEIGKLTCLEELIV